MRRKLRKLLSTLLALTMVLSLLPTGALATSRYYTVKATVTPEKTATFTLCEDTNWKPDTFVEKDDTVDEKLSTSTDTRLIITPADGFVIAGITVNGKPLSGFSSDSHTIRNIDEDTTVVVTTAPKPADTSTITFRIVNGTWNTTKLAADSYTISADRKEITFTTYYSRKVEAYVYQCSMASYSGNTVESLLKAILNGENPGDYITADTGYTLNGMTNQDWTVNAGGGLKNSTASAYNQMVAIKNNPHGYDNHGNDEKDGFVAGTVFTLTLTKLDYSVKGTIDNGGTVTNGTQSKKYQEMSEQMVFTPASGYVISGVTKKVNGNPVADFVYSLNADGTYTYPAESVVSDVEINVTTTRANYNITVEVENGTATPGTSPISVNYGGSQNISFAPNSGYALESVTVDGKTTVLNGNAYTFSNVTADHSIKVVYGLDSNSNNTPDSHEAKVTYRVVNGTWSDKSTADQEKWFILETYNTVTGAWDAVTPAPALGSTIPTGMVPDASHTDAGSWDPAATAATAVTKEAVYTYTFNTVKSYNITVEVENGTATPGTSPISVNYGGSQNISFAPNSGYALESVTVDGKTTVLNGNAYTFSNVTADHSIKVVYGLDSNSNNTPDSHEAKVTYRVVNGTWSDKSTADQEKWFTLETYNTVTGAWDAADPTPTLSDTIPTGMIANEHYTDETAGWDAVAPSSSTEVKGDATYTYRFIKVGSATFNPDNAPFDNRDDGVIYQPIFYKKLTGILPGAETFQITLTEKVRETDGGNIEINPDADNKFDVVKPAVYTGTVTMSAAGRMAFNCETMTFDQPGHYVFSVKETKGDKSYITYDTAEYELIIEVGYPGVEWASAQSEQESEETAQLEILYWYIQSVSGAMGIEGQLEGDFNNSSSYTPSVTPVIPDPTVKVKGLDTINHVAYIVGRNTGLVDPNGTITRAEVATIYFRLMTEEFRNQFWSDKCSYTDVADTAWYNVAISTLENAGVIKDTITGGSFRPNDPITRAELAVMAAQFCTVTGNIPRASFTDIPYTYWAAKEIALVEYAGWIEGYNGKFRPDDNLTRAECVTIVNRMLNRGAEPENMLKNMVIFPDNLNVDVWYYAAIQEAANSHTYTRTGKLLTGEHFNGEKWTALQAAPDWAAMEQAWANANRK